MLRGFSDRPDVQRNRRRLLNTGIAGTDIVYPFGFSTAKWLAARCGGRLTVEWKDVARPEVVEGRLQPFSLWAERPVFDEPPLDGRAWLDRLRGNETDAAFIIRRSAAMPVRGMVNDHLYDELGLTLRIAAGPDSPDRTRARMPGHRLVTQRAPLRLARPDIAAEIMTPPKRIRRIGEREARVLAGSGPRGDGDACPRSLYVHGRQPEGRLPRRLRRRPRVLLRRRRSRAAPAARRRLRHPHAPQRRAHRLRPLQRALAVVGSRLQRLRELPRRRVGLGLWPAARRDPRDVRGRHVHHRPVSAGPSQRRRPRVGRVVVLLQARVQALGSRHCAARGERGREGRRAEGLPHRSWHLRKLVSANLFLQLGPPRATCSARSRPAPSASR